jgi:hypothetical protein
MSPAPPAPIHWRLAWGVVALQLGWMIYRAYQPALLSSHGFSRLLLPFALLPLLAVVAAATGLALAAGASLPELDGRSGARA